MIKLCISDMHNFQANFLEPTPRSSASVSCNLLDTFGLLGFKRGDKSKISAYFLLAYSLLERGFGSAKRALEARDAA